MTINSVCLLKFWHKPYSPCVKYSIITGIVLTALSFIIVGSLAYSGVHPLNDVFYDFTSLLMLSVGLKIILAGAILFYFVILRESVVSFNNYQKYSSLLKEGEFFVFYKDAEESQRMLFIKDSNLQNNQLDHTLHYQEFKKKYKEVREGMLELRHQELNQ